MITLFIDTHSAILNLGIEQDGKLLKEIKESSHMEHSSKTLLYIQRMFKELNLKPNDIDKIIVVNGPGSYTGLRIGVTIAKTYAYSLNKEVIPVSSLMAMALSNSDFDYIVPTIDAKREHVFGAIYDKNYNEVLNGQYISIEDLDNEVSKLNGNIKKVEDEQDLDILNIIKYYKNKNGVNPHSLVPDYLKETYIEKK